MVDIPNLSLGVFSIHSDPLPLPKLLSSVTNAIAPIATTTTDHGYESGWYVTMLVPPEYGMSLPMIQTKITVLDETSFACDDIDTTLQPAFATPGITSYTQAQVIPTSGITANYARADGTL